MSGKRVYGRIPYTCRSLSEAKKIYIDVDAYLVLLDSVYEPAEDTWQTLEGLRQAARLLGRRFKPGLCVDIGAGSGVLLISCTRYFAAGQYVGTDVNPCAAVNTRRNLELHGVGHLGEAVQCDGASCIRGVERPVIIVFNAPYLEADTGEARDGMQGDLHELSYVGGGDVILRILADVASRIGSPHVVVVTLSSLTDLSVEDIVELGYRVCGEIISHYFFEDIITLVLCKWLSG